MPLRVLCVFGTRPEAIKMAPVVRALKADARFAVSTCLTAQHRDLVDDVVRVFALPIDADLDAMRAGQTPNEVLARIVGALPAVLERFAPDVVLVQGDTTTTLGAALAAFHAGIPVGHIEAGLRSFDREHPFPEEIARRLVTTMATLHFAPTPQAERNLRAEQVPADAITMTGNTAIDALLWVLASGARPALPDALASGAPRRRSILVTAHRRESFGDAMTRICAAVAALAARGDVDIIFPVHPNPAVRVTVDAALGGLANVHLLPPLDYPTLVHLLGRAALVVSDSGGLQEEAPALGIPVLVLRDVTERPEAIDIGAARLCGTDTARIVAEATRLLDDPAAYAQMAVRRTPFGDGHAAERIRDALSAWALARNAPRTRP